MRSCRLALAAATAGVALASATSLQAAAPQCPAPAPAPTSVIVAAPPYPTCVSKGCIDDKKSAAWQATAKAWNQWVKDERGRASQAVKWSQSALSYYSCMRSALPMG